MIRGNSLLDYVCAVWIVFMIFWLAVRGEPVGVVLFVLLATSSGAVMGRGWARSAELRELRRDVQRLRRETDELDRWAKEMGLLP